MAAGGLSSALGLPKGTLTTWDQETNSHLVLFDGKLLIRMNDGVWDAVSTTDGARTALPALAPCGFLFTNETELFCGPAFGSGTIYEIAPEALAG